MRSCSPGALSSREAPYNEALASATWITCDSVCARTVWTECSTSSTLEWTGINVSKRKGVTHAGTTARHALGMICKGWTCRIESGKMRHLMSHDMPRPAVAVVAPSIWGRTRGERETDMDVRLIAPAALCTRDLSSASLQLNLAGVRTVKLVLVSVLFCRATCAGRGGGVL